MCKTGEHILILILWIAFSRLPGDQLARFQGMCGSPDRGVGELPAAVAVASQNERDLSSGHPFGKVCVIKFHAFQCRSAV